jgi:excisionase family DNA binding protein
MRAHEWTRARQRSVRQLGGTPGEVAEEEEAAEPESGLLTEEDPAEPASAVQAGPVEAADEVQAQPVAAAEPGEPPEEKPEPDDIAAEAVGAAAEAEAGDRAPTEELPEDAAAEPQAGLFTDSEAVAAPLLRPVTPTPTRRRSAPRPQQAELPLGLEPVVEKPSRRSVTETREELIQRLLDPHLSLQETAKLLNVCPTTVRRYTNRGLLAHYRTPGNQRRFRLSDVLAFMERQGIPAHGLERKRSGTMGEDEGATNDGP